jgi:hypothetical protein
LRQQIRADRKERFRKAKEMFQAFRDLRAAGLKALKAESAEMMQKVEGVIMDALTKLKSLGATPRGQLAIDLSNMGFAV